MKDPIHSSAINSRIMIRKTAISFFLLSLNQISAMAGEMNIAYIFNSAMGSWNQSLVHSNQLKGVITTAKNTVPQSRR